MIRSFKGIRPRIGQRVFIDDSALVIGDAEIGDDSSVWMGSVLRADVNRIRVGCRTNVQDQTVIHVGDGDHSTTIGDDVTVGHAVVLHGCRIEAGCLIGIGARVLDGAVVGEGTVVGAGCLVPEGRRVPPGRLVMGVPARDMRGITEAERSELLGLAARYVLLKDEHRGESAR